eukprot:377895-Pelagomonas_calceolata.AAC.10
MLKATRGLLSEDVGLLVSILQGERPNIQGTTIVLASTGVAPCSYKGSGKYSCVTLSFPFLATKAACCRVQACQPHSSGALRKCTMQYL